MSNITINQVKLAVDANLPDCWLSLEACLSTVGAAMLKDLDHCIGLILVGEPGGRKSTTLELLGNKEPIIRLYDFTPKSFVSHNAAKKKDDLAEIDLLPKIKHSVMVIPELGPMFGKRNEDLVQDIAILTAVMDGKGYRSSSGVHGIRGYEGDFRFSMIGATTPFERKVWQALGRLSSRWIFYRLETASTEFKSLRENFAENKQLCQAIVEVFLKDFWQGFGKVSWDRLGDSEDMGHALSDSAVAMSRWRGLVVNQNGTGYNHPIIEAPDRLRETLYALARGHALLCGRAQLDWDDVRFVTCLNETNMPEDRLRVFRAFTDDTPALSIRAAAKAIVCSKDRAEGVLLELVDLGVVEKDDLQRYRRIL